MRSLGRGFFIWGLSGSNRVLCKIFGHDCFILNFRFISDDCIVSLVLDRVLGRRFSIDDFKTSILGFGWHLSRLHCHWIDLESFFRSLLRAPRPGEPSTRRWCSCILLGRCVGCVFYGGGWLVNADSISFCNRCCILVVGCLGVLGGHSARIDVFV